MNQNRVTVRYATALIETATEKKLLETVEQDIRLLYKAIVDFKGFKDYLENPGVISNEKYKQVEGIFKKELSELTMRFLELVFSKGRENFLKDICRNFIDMSREKRGIVTAELTSAQKLDKVLLDKIKTRFEERMKKTIEMTSSVKKELIGGFIFSIDGQQYDASIATRIESMKKQLQIK